MMQNSKQRAFTLIEVMVATVIMVILVGLVIQITTQVLNVWTKSSGKLSANAEARIAMELITQDLETAVFRNNGQQWLRVDGPENTANDSNYDSQTVALKLFSPSLTRDKVDAVTGDPIPGDVCAIAYRLEYQEAYSGASEKVYALYRAIAKADDTFNNMLGSRSMSSSPQVSLAENGSNTPGFWKTTSILDSQNYLASNIVDFKVLMYVEDASATNGVRLYNANANLELQGDYAYGGDTSDAAVSTARLLYADVILKVVSDEGLEILSLLADGRGGTGYANSDEVIREYGKSFSRRVYFPASPL